VVGLRWPPWAAGSSGALPESIRIDLWVEARQKAQAAAEVPPQGTWWAVSRLDPGDHPAGQGKRYARR